MYLRPPPLKEELTTNLLPLLEVPSRIYLAHAAARDYPAAGAILDAADQRASGWILRDGMVMSFSDLRTPPLNLLCDGAVQELSTEEWSGGADQDILYRYMDLLSRTVQDGYPDLRWHKTRRHLHFRATKSLGPRKAGKGQGVRGRTVFGPHKAKSDPSRVSYYHHAAVRLRFRRLLSTWYCQIEPDYCFTSDGFNESGFADSLLAGIKRLERHPAVAGWIRVWANHLGRDPDLFSPSRPVRLGELERIEVEAGIDDRWWGPAPVTAMPDEDAGAESGDEDLADEELAQADIDTLDLLSLLEEPSPPRRRRRRRPSAQSSQPDQTVVRDRLESPNGHAS